MSCFRRNTNYAWNGSRFWPAATVFLVVSGARAAKLDHADTGGHSRDWSLVLLGQVNCDDAASAITAGIFALLRHLAGRGRGLCVAREYNL